MQGKIGIGSLECTGSIEETLQILASPECITWFHFDLCINATIAPDAQIVRKNLAEHNSGEARNMQHCSMHIHLANLKNELSQSWWYSHVDPTRESNVEPTFPLHSHDTVKSTESLEHISGRHQ